MARVVEHFVSAVRVPAQLRGMLQGRIDRPFSSRRLSAPERLDAADHSSGTYARPGACHGMHQLGRRSSEPSDVAIRIRKSRVRSKQHCDLACAVRAGECNDFVVTDVNVHVPDRRNRRSRCRFRGPVHRGRSPEPRVGRSDSVAHRVWEPTMRGYKSDPPGPYGNTYPFNTGNSVTAASWRVFSAIGASVFEAVLLDVCTGTPLPQREGFEHRHPRCARYVHREADSRRPLPFCATTPQFSSPTLDGRRQRARTRSDSPLSRVALIAGVDTRGGHAYRLANDVGFCEPPTVDSWSGASPGISLVRQRSGLYHEGTFLWVLRSVLRGLPSRLVRRIFGGMCR